MENFKDTPRRFTQTPSRTQHQDIEAAQVDAMQNFGEMENFKDTPRRLGGSSRRANKSMSSLEFNEHKYSSSSNKHPNFVSL
jgi:hypothetical protein